MMKQGHIRRCDSETLLANVSWSSMYPSLLLVAPTALCTRCFLHPLPASASLQADSRTCVQNVAATRVQKLAGACLVVVACIRLPTFPPTTRGPHYRDLLLTSSRPPIDRQPP